MKKITSLSALLALIFLSSCDKEGLWYNHKWEKMHPNGQNVSLTCNDTAGIVSYSGKVVPILTTNCSLNDKNCHSPISGRDLTTHAAVAAYAAGTSPGTMLENYIYQTPVATSPMPPVPQSKLAPCDLAIITQWIKQGALDN